MKKIIPILSIFALGGCATQLTTPPLPEKAEFSLPPAELTTKYEAIEDFAYHEGPRGRVTLGNLEDKWGAPISGRIDWKGLLAFDVVIGTFSYLGSFGHPDPAFVGATIGLISILNIYQAKQYVWQEGGYRVSGNFARVGFEKDPRLVSWDWEYRERDEQQYVSWFSDLNQLGVFYSLSYSAGGGEIGKTVDAKKKTLHAGDNTDFRIGWRFPLHRVGYSINISGGVRYSGYLLPTLGTRFVQYPITGVLEYRIPNQPFRLGAGAVTALSPTLSGMSFEGSRINVDFDPGIGGVLQLEYRSDARSGAGLRYENLNLRSQLGNLDASSFAVYATLYF